MSKVNAKKWSESVALITGAGSGIGKGLAKAAAARGAKVIACDIDGESAERTAGECGSRTEAFTLDVTDFKAMESLVASVVHRHGSIDYLFNNAGIGIGGETFELSLAAWDKIIDINIKGVINGIHAVYPLMIRQGSGQIINTASLAGLGPAPLLTTYSMTKHAVVGLSVSLRIEAAKYGIGVSTLCPAAIETPILDKPNPSDIPEIPWAPDIRRFLTKIAGKPYPVEKFSEEALAAIEKNKSIIVIPGKARLLWRLGRLFPALTEIGGLQAVAAERAERTAKINLTGSTV